MPTPFLGRLFERKPKTDHSVARAQRLAEQILSRFSIPGTTELYLVQPQANKSKKMSGGTDQHRHILFVRVERFMAPDVMLDLQYYIKRKICERPSITLKPDEFSVCVMLHHSLPDALTQRVVGSERIALATAPVCASHHLVSKSTAKVVALQPTLRRMRPFDLHAAESAGGPDEQQEQVTLPGVQDPRPLRSGTGK